LYSDSDRKADDYTGISMSVSQKISRPKIKIVLKAADSVTGGERCPSCGYIKELENLKVGEDIWD
jgi:hypothetical protein